MRQYMIPAYCKVCVAYVDKTQSDNSAQKRAHVPITIQLNEWYIHLIIFARIKHHMGQYVPGFLIESSRFFY
jgi:hypothetical protein